MLLSVVRMCGLCTVLLPLVSVAADFELSVPIKLERLMSSVGEVMITCQVMNEDEDVIGHGQQKRRIEGMNYEGKVVVEFDANVGKNPNEATRYKCTMRLRQISGREYLIPQSETEEPDWPIWARARGDAELVYEISGSLSGDAEAAPATAK